MKTAILKERQIYLVIGLISVSVGVICNEWILTKVYSYDGVLEPEYRIPIRIFDITLIIVGSAMIKYRQSIKAKESIMLISQKYPRVIAFLVGIVLSIIMLFFAEFVFYVLNTYKDKNKPERVVIHTGSNKYWQTDELLGYKPQPNAQRTAKMKLNGETIYKVTYSIDKYSRRVTPVSNHDNRTNYILFFGGSFTLGEGVNDNETIPFYSSELAPCYMPYNYGFHGYGPHQMLAKLMSNNFKKEINETCGKLIYVFIDSHIDRAIGSMYVFNSFGRRMPYYTIDNNGSLIRNGNFLTGRPKLSFIYMAIDKSQIAKYFHVNLPPKINDFHIRLTSKIIEESYNTFREKFNSSEFYVLFYPGSKYAKRMTPHLKDAGIKILDYSSLLDMSEKQFHIEGDGHPTKKTQNIVAKRLVRDLEMLEKRN